MTKRGGGGEGGTRDEDRERGGTGLARLEERTGFGKAGRTDTLAGRQAGITVGIVS